MMVLTTHNHHALRKTNLFDALFKASGFFGQHLRNVRARLMSVDQRSREITSLHILSTTVVRRLVDNSDYTWTMNPAGRNSHATLSNPSQNQIEKLLNAR